MKLVVRIAVIFLVSCLLSNQLLAGSVDSSVSLYPITASLSFTTEAMSLREALFTQPMLHFLAIRAGLSSATFKVGLDEKIDHRSIQFAQLIQDIQTTLQSSLVSHLQVKSWYDSLSNIDQMVDKDPMLTSEALYNDFHEISKRWLTLAESAEAAVCTLLELKAAVEADFLLEDLTLRMSALKGHQQFYFDYHGKADDIARIRPLTAFFAEVETKINELLSRTAEITRNQTALDDARKALNDREAELAKLAMSPVGLEQFISNLTLWAADPRIPLMDDPMLYERYHGLRHRAQERIQEIKRQAAARREQVSA